jgi:hypothetical protein
VPWSTCATSRSASSRTWWIYNPGPRDGLLCLVPVAAWICPCFVLFCLQHNRATVLESHRSSQRRSDRRCRVAFIHVARLIWPKWPWQTLNGRVEKKKMNCNNNNNKNSITLHVYLLSDGRLIYVSSDLPFVSCLHILCDVAGMWSPCNSPFHAQNGWDQWDSHVLSRNVQDYGITSRNGITSQCSPLGGASGPGEGTLDSTTTLCGFSLSRAYT